MTYVLFALIGMVVLDHIFSRNRRARRPHYPPYFREDAPYSPRPYAARYTPETSDFLPYSAHYRHNLDDFAPHYRTQSPIVSTFIFMIILIGLFYFLGH